MSVGVLLKGAGTFRLFLTPYVHVICGGEETTVSLRSKERGGRGGERKRERERETCGRKGNDCEPTVFVVLTLPVPQHINAILSS